MHNFVMLKQPKNFMKKITLYTCKKPVMIAYKRSKSAWDNFGKFIYQFQLETRKLEKILIKLYRQNVSLWFNQTCLNERLLPNYTHTYTHTHIYIYIYIYIEREREREIFPTLLIKWGEWLVICRFIQRLKTIFSENSHMWKIQFFLLTCWPYNNYQLYRMHWDLHT